MDKTIWSSFLGETWDKDKKVGAPFLLILLGFYVFFRPSSPATRSYLKRIRKTYKGLTVRSWSTETTWGSRVIFFSIDAPKVSSGRFKHN